MSRRDFNELLKGITVLALMSGLFYGFICFLSYNKAASYKEDYCTYLNIKPARAVTIKSHVLKNIVEDGYTPGEKSAIRGWNSKTCEQYDAARNKLAEKLND